MAGLDRRQIVFGLLALCAYLIGVFLQFRPSIGIGSPPDAIWWNLAHLHANYGEFGFIRRGLLGTVFSPLLALVADGGRAEILLLLGIDLALALVLIWLAARLFAHVDMSRLWPAALVLGPVGFVQFGYDVGRLDHVNFLVIAAALVAVVRGRIGVASGLLALALLVHEAVLFYGVPLVLAVIWTRRGIAGVVAAGAPALAVTVALFRFGDVAEGIDPAGLLPADMTLAASVWTRDMLEPARGFPPLHYLIAAYFAFVPLLLLRRHYRAAHLRIDPIFLAPFACLALFALGVDYGRWGHCLFFTVLCTIALAPALQRPSELDLTPAWVKVAITPWLLPLGPIGIAVLYPLIPWIV